MFITTLVVISLVYATLQAAWYIALLTLYVLAAMMNPLLVGTVCVVLLVSVIAYTSLDIMNKYRHGKDPTGPCRPIEEQVIEQSDID